MVTPNRRTISLALGALTAATIVAGCSSTAPQTGPDGVAGLSTSGGSADPLTAALTQIPNMPDGYVDFTNWAALGHPSSTNPMVQPYAASLFDEDGQLGPALGITSAQADWEIDVSAPQQAPVVVLEYASNSALSGLAAKLAALGYHANGSLYSNKPDPNSMWSELLQNIAIDTRRHLLVGGSNASEVSAVFADGGETVAQNPSIAPILSTTAAALNGKEATAEVFLGSSACVPLNDLAGRNISPAMLAALRAKFAGTFDPPQGEVVTVPSLTGTTAFDALSFTDAATAQADESSRAAAVREFGSLMYGDPAALSLTRSQVSGRVLGLSLSAPKVHAFMNGLSTVSGADVCP